MPKPMYAFHFELRVGRSHCSVKCNSWILLDLGCRVRSFALFVCCDALCIINSMILTSILIWMEISENLSSKVTIKQRIYIFRE